MSEAKALGLPTTTHIGVEETTAKDYIELGVTSIEHFYGIADAALDGVQNFPPDMNYSNEFHRFARAGELYAQANPEKLRAIVELMAEQGRRVEPDAVDLRGQPRRHPRAEPAVVSRLPAPVDGAVLEPEPRQSRLVLRRLGQHAGSALAPELPHLDGRAARTSAARAASSRPATTPATSTRSTASASCASSSCTRRPASIRSKSSRTPPWNGARLLGLGERLGKVRVGFTADLLVVNGNPLENLRAAEPGRHRRRRQRPASCTAAGSSGRSRTASPITARR